MEEEGEGRRKKGGEDEEKTKVEVAATTPKAPAAPTDLAGNMLSKHLEG